MSASSSYIGKSDRYRHAQFHISTPQKVIRIMHYSPTLRHIPAPAACSPMCTYDSSDLITINHHYGILK